MASNVEFVEYVCNQIQCVGYVINKKMFGEYMVYVNDKPILLICDNTVFVKKLEIIGKNMINAEVGCPYVGAKEHYILDIDNAEFSKKIVTLLESVTKVPVKKKKNKKQRDLL